MDQKPVDRKPLEVEFAVNFDSHEDLLKIVETLKDKGVELVSFNLSDKTIQVLFDGHNNHLDAAGRHQASSGLCDVQSLQKYIEKETGFLAVIKGMGHLRSAVTELRPPPSMAAAAVALHQSSPPSNGLFGVVRLSQMTDDVCVADGLIDAGQIDSEFWNGKRNAQADECHRLLVAIHEFGDLSSDNYDSIGDPVVYIQEQKLDGINQYTTSPGSSLTISIHKTISNCNVIDVIGKSLALSLLTQHNESDKTECKRQVLSAGVIARASTIAANKKQVCSCSGKILWQEREERQNRP